MKVAIIGAGIVGLATALELKRQQPGYKIFLLEKEVFPGFHQSTHNSGVLHAGIYYKPGSLKARLSVRGIKLMIQFCEMYGVPYETCGKLILATSPCQMPQVEKLWENAQANGLREVRKIGCEEIREYEPNAAGIGALHVPEEGIVDYAEVCKQMMKRLIGQGVALHESTRVKKLKREPAGWRILTEKGDFGADFIITCAGLTSDRVAKMTGQCGDTAIIPFRGEYYRLKQESEHLVRNLIYPVPDPEFPFLGVHFTRMIRGGVEAGPNAVLSFNREDYRGNSINLRDTFESLSYPGLWRFLKKYPRMTWMEFKRSCSKALFCRSLQELVPAVCENDLEAGGVGIRAQAMTLDGNLVQDFQILEKGDILHVLNAPSPAATASLAIGEHIVTVFNRIRANKS